MIYIYSVQLSLLRTTHTGNKHCAIAIRIVRSDLNYGISGDEKVKKGRGLDIMENKGGNLLFLLCRFFFPCLIFFLLLFLLHCLFQFLSSRFVLVGWFFGGARRFFSLNLFGFGQLHGFPGVYLLSLFELGLELTRIWFATCRRSRLKENHCCVNPTYVQNWQNGWQGSQQ